MFKKIIIGLSVLILIVLALAFMQPATYSVTRSIAIKAPPERIQPLISDFHNWPLWSPWEKLDPAMKRTFSGATKDIGAVYAWEGNKDVGRGRMEVISLAQPTKVGIKLDFYEPMESAAMTDFVLDAKGETTTVTWTMSGKTDFIAKVMGVFVSMDSMIGPDFERGLSQIKAVAEK
jgi:hypothetical protein